jgi:hypothetical protein
MNFFSKVTVARQLLRDKAEDILKEYLDIAAQAKAAGDYESAYKALQWLIDHMPKEGDGEALVGRSADKEAPQLPSSGDSKPRIMIGIQVGGAQKALPTATIVEADEDESS